VKKLARLLPSLPTSIPTRAGARSHPAWRFDGVGEPARVGSRRLFFAAPASAQARQTARGVAGCVTRPAHGAAHTAGVGAAGQDSRRRRARVPACRPLSAARWRAAAAGRRDAVPDEPSCMAVPRSRRLAHPPDRVGPIARPTNVARSR
jgi:hypothetical protein